MDKKKRKRKEVYHHYAKSLPNICHSVIDLFINLNIGTDAG